MSRVGVRDVKMDVSACIQLIMLKPLQHKTAEKYHLTKIYLTNNDKRLQKVNEKAKPAKHKQDNTWNRSSYYFEICGIII